MLHVCVYDAETMVTRDEDGKGGFKYTLHDMRTEEQKDMAFACEEVNRIAPGVEEMIAAVTKEQILVRTK